MKTENFTYKATIDWIELEVSTIEDSNFYSIKQLFHANFVEPIKPGSGGATKKFRLRIQDLTSWKALEGIVDIANWLKPLSTVFITAIEISFDAYSKSTNKDELIEKTAEFYWLLANPSSQNHRAAGIYKGSAVSLTSHSSTMRKIANQMSIYIGSQKEDLISQRIYYKTTDNRKSIPVNLHRARYELILKGEACPFRTIEEAKEYNFTKLANWFKFRAVDSSIDSFSLMLVKATKQLGRINTQRRVGGGRKVHSFGTNSDSALNRIAYNKLRELSDRLGKTRVVRKLGGVRFINPI